MVRRTSSAEQQGNDANKKEVSEKYVTANNNRYRRPYYSKIEIEI
jgi:hypothetical protein